MLKKSGKRTESKKLKESVSASKTRIKKMPLAGLRDWAGSKLDSGRSWARNTSTKTRVGLICAALLIVGGASLPFVGIEKPLAQLSSMMQSDEKAKSRSTAQAELKHEREKSPAKARAEASFPAVSKFSASRSEAAPVKASQPAAKPASKHAKLNKKADGKKLSKKAKLKAGKSKVAEKAKAKGRAQQKSKSKAIKGKSLAAKDK